MSKYVSNCNKKDEPATIDLPIQKLDWRDQRAKPSFIQDSSRLEIVAALRSA